YLEMPQLVGLDARGQGLRQTIGEAFRRPNVGIGQRIGQSYRVPGKDDWTRLRWQEIRRLVGPEFVVDVAEAYSELVAAQHVRKGTIERLTYRLDRGTLHERRAELCQQRWQALAQAPVCHCSVVLLPEIERTVGFHAGSDDSRVTDDAHHRV